MALGQVQGPFFFNSSNNIREDFSMSQLRQKLRFLMTTAFVASVLAGCGSHKTSDSSSKFLLIHNEGHGLMPKMSSKVLRVCLLVSDDSSTSVKGMDQTEWSRWIVSAIRKWQAPIKDLTGKAIENELKFLVAKDGCSRDVASNSNISDLTVSVEKKLERSYYNLGGIHLGLSDLPNVEAILLHEMGHAFGLADAYKERGGCKLGLPPSVMCMSPRVYEDLQSDDIAGVQRSYCDTFSQEFHELCAGIRLEGPVKAKSAQGSPLFNLTGLDLVDFHNTFVKITVTSKGEHPRIVRRIFTRNKDLDLARVKAEYDAEAHVFYVEDVHQKGAWIVAVHEGTNAQRAGLKVNMIISEFEDEVVVDSQRLRTLVEYVHLPRVRFVVSGFNEEVEKNAAGTGLGASTYIDAVLMGAG